MRGLHVGLALSIFLACFCGLGTVYTFGYWVPALLDEFGASNAQTQVILGLLQGGFFLGGIPGRAVLRRWGFRTVYAGGGAVASATFLLISFAPRIWFIYFVGIASLGMQASWMVAGTLIQRHMPANQATRYGAFAVTGSGIGVMFWSSIARLCLPTVGWRVGFRVMAASFAVLYALGAVFQKAPEPLPKAAGAEQGGYASLLREKRFQLFCATSAIGGCGFMMTFAVQAAHARANGVGMEDVSTIYTMYGLASVFGRILVGVVGGRVNPLVVWAAAHYLVAASVVAVGFSTKFWHFALANVMLGISSGPMIALIVPSVRVLVGVERLPEALVASIAVQALTSVPAPALAGYLADVAGSYLFGLSIAAGGLVIAALIMTYVVVQGRRLDPPEGPVPASGSDTLAHEAAAADVEGPDRACKKKDEFSAVVCSDGGRQAPPEVPPKNGHSCDTGADARQLFVKWYYGGCLAFLENIIGGKVCGGTAKRGAMNLP